jgi:hypothetical protein
MSYYVSFIELTISIESVKFKELVKKAKRNAKLSSYQFVKTDYGHYDETLIDSGIIVEYHCGNKRKIKLKISPGMLLSSSDITESWSPTEKNIDKLLRELDNLIDAYFDYEYRLNDFKLYRIDSATNITFDCREKVAAYFGVFNNLGRVKGYSRKFSYGNKRSSKTISFDLIGNSNGIEVSAFDLESVLIQKYPDITKDAQKRARGILGIEIRLITQKSIRKHTEHDATTDRIADIASKCMEIFAEIIIDVVPFGDFYKKTQAVKIIESKVKNGTMRRKMLKLMDLIHKKKSLHLAQQEMKDRHIYEIMAEFQEINVSPVTISKRQEINYLENIYKYL